MKVQKTGFFGGEGKQVEYPGELMDYPVSRLMSGNRLRDEAIRSLDKIMCDGGKGIVNGWLAARWLVVKKYIVPVEFEKYHWMFGNFVYAVTDAGREFHRANAAPMGEW